MDENVERIMRIYQKHEVMEKIGMCCSAERPCDTVVLFDEIKRLNGQIAALNALVEGLALTQGATD